MRSSRSNPVAWRLSRSGGGSPDPLEAASRAKAFGASLGSAGSATLVVMRDAQGLSSFVTMPDSPGAPAVAADLADAVSARIEPLADGEDGGSLLPDLTDAAVVGYAVESAGARAARDSQVGGDPNAVAALLARTMEPGSWVAVGLRQPTRRGLVRRGGEEEAVRTWWRHRIAGLATHYSNESEAVVASFAAGGSSADEVRQLLKRVTATMPGFDIDIHVRIAHSKQQVALGLAGAGVAAEAGVGISMSSWVLGALAGCVPALGALAVLAGFARTGARRVESQLDSGTLPPPRRRIRPPRPPRLEGPDREGKGRRPASAGDYPLHRTSFLVSPVMVIGIASPHTGAGAGAASTRKQEASPALLADVGAVIGTAGDSGAKVHRSDRDGHSATAVFGAPGVGKAQPLTSRVPVPAGDRYPDGWATIGELQVGDLVYGSDGKPTRVAALSPIFMGDVHELELSDGQRIAADAGHLWSATDRRGRLVLSTAGASGSRHRRNEAARRRRSAEVRAIAQAQKQGAVASLSDIASLLGEPREVLARFARASGIEPVRVERTITAPATRTGLRRCSLWRTTEALEAIRSVEADPRSTVRLRARPSVRRLDAWASSSELAAALLTEPDRDLTPLLRDRDVRRYDGMRPSTHASAGRSRVVDCYPMRELLSGYAAYVAVKNQGRPASRVVTTADIAASLHAGGDARANWSIPVAQPISGPVSRLPVPPYLIGYWLGDGDSSGGTVTVGSQDLANAWRLLAAEWPKLRRLPSTEGADVARISFPGRDPGMRLHGHDDWVVTNGGARYCRSCRTGLGGDGRDRRSLGGLLEDLGVLNGKHIPASYRRAGAADRLALLQGLMDTDGSIAHDGGCELTLCSERLALDALELIRSLGIKASITSGDASITETGPDGPIRRVVGIRYRIHFTTARPVFRFDRKLALIRTGVSPTQDWLYVTGVRRIGAEPVRCISVEAADSLYLTEQFVPTHNSVLVNALFGYDCLERMRPSGKPGRPGRSNTLIAFETKSDGLGGWLQWVGETGDSAMVIEVADAATPAIDMLDTPGTTYQRATTFVNAVRYALGEGQIGPESYDTLKRIFTASLAVTSGMRMEAGIEADDSFMSYSDILLGGHGDDAGQELVKQLVRAAAAGGEDAREALRQIAPIYGPAVTPAQRRTLLNAPRNKVPMLLEAGFWWASDRPKVSWRDVLDGHWSVIINSGPSRSGQMLDESISRTLGSMLLFTLQQEIARNCGGWQAQGRFVSIYADEVSLLAKHSPESVAWLRNQGRSYGVRLTLATQYPDQLLPDVRTVMLSSRTVLWFVQSEAGTLQLAADDLSADGSPWTGADIANLSKYTAVMRAVVDEARQPAVPVSMINWPALRGRFAEEQGYR